MPSPGPSVVEVVLTDDQWTAVTDTSQVILFGLVLLVFLLAVVAVGSFRR